MNKGLPMSRLVRFMIMLFEFVMMFFFWLGTVSFFDQGSTGCIFQSFSSRSSDSFEQCINSLPFFQKILANHQTAVMVVTFIAWLLLLFLVYYFQDKYLLKQVNKKI